MNLTTRAILFNALLLPGWGELYLKKYKRGLLIIFGILAGMLSLVWSIVQSTLDILKIAPVEKGTITFASIIKLTISAIKGLNLFYTLIIVFFMILIWIFSIIDAYLLGKEEMAKISNLSDQESTSPED